MDENLIINFANSWAAILRVLRGEESFSLSIARDHLLAEGGGNASRVWDFLQTSEAPTNSKANYAQFSHGTLRLVQSQATARGRTFNGPKCGCRRCCRWGPAFPFWRSARCGDRGVTRSRRLRRLIIGKRVATSVRCTRGSTKPRFRPIPAKMPARNS